MSFSIGIVGLPNVGKSTLFNALTQAQNAEAANYPFCTIEPHQAIVAVPDARLEALAKTIQPETLIHATVTFWDIAGLVRGASKGEGLGNQFLGQIRNVDAILHVVRCFHDENVVHVDADMDPVRDVETVETELLLADLQTVTERVDKLRRLARAEKSARPLLLAAEQVMAQLEAGQPAMPIAPDGDPNHAAFLRDTPLLSAKPKIYCGNVGEDRHDVGVEALSRLQAHAEAAQTPCVAICARMEEELIGLEPEERAEFLASCGLEQSGLDQTIKASFKTLDLVSFFTTNGKEVRAWTVPRGTTAPRAAGKIHTDFERGFIRAEVVPVDAFVGHGSAAACKTAGELRVEGKDYLVHDGDVILFRFSV